MKTIINYFALIVSIITISVFFVNAQSNKDKAIEKAQQAFKLDDEEKYDEAIKLLEEAQKLDPGYSGYTYEIAYAYYSKKDYITAKNILESLQDKNDIDDQVVRLLGNCYDILGDSSKAMETYKNGLKKFPNSGCLYLELGVMHRNEYDKSIVYYEKGIEVAPDFPSNYYWAAKIFCNSSEKVWGLIYGEIFMNLERNTKRTAEISKLLFNTYKKGINISSDTSIEVSFSKNNVMSISDISDKGKIKLPFGVGVYEPTILISFLGEKKIDMSSLDRIRQKFSQKYVLSDFDKKYPNIIFDYQDKIDKAGHFEAYNHWILMKGDEDEFDAWYKENKEKWDNFTKWFLKNPLKLDEKHKFFRSQYQ